MILRGFRQRFWLPPRAHGEVIEDRTVSFLELFYDLVYVVVIAQAAHTLAEHVTWRTTGEFVVIFGLLWFAWVNGTLYYEVHGREDGRTRAYVFIQMLLVALMAVYTGGAAGDQGREFAIVYLLYLLVLTWLWYTVRRQDSEEYMSITARYLVGMAVSIVVMGVTVPLPDGARVVVWAILLGGWSLSLLTTLQGSRDELGVTATESMAERYGLFVIIVLGEVVVGVVDGLTEAERSARIIATGMLGMAIGFAYWWTYFDFAGRRLPRNDGPSLGRWLGSHLPVTMGIAAAGAAMVSLVEHGADAATPVPTAWLLTGSVAVGLVALVVHMSALVDFERLSDVYRPVSIALVVAAGVGLLFGWLAPTPWLLALIVVLLLAAVWLFAVDRWLRRESGPRMDDPVAG